jgi:hypothetical protein
VLGGLFTLACSHPAPLNSCTDCPPCGMDAGSIAWVWKCGTPVSQTGWIDPRKTLISFDMARKARVWIQQGGGTVVSAGLDALRATLFDCLDPGLRRERVCKTHASSACRGTRLAASACALRASADRSPRLPGGSPAVHDSQIFASARSRSLIRSSGSSRPMARRIRGPARSGFDTVRLSWGSQWMARLSKPP